MIDGYDVQATRKEAKEEGIKEGIQKAAERYEDEIRNKNEEIKKLQEKIKQLENKRT